MEEKVCPYNHWVIQYENGVCKRYLEYNNSFLREGKYSEICPDSEGCEYREIRIKNSIHSVPLSEEV